MRKNDRRAGDSKAQGEQLIVRGSGRRAPSFATVGALSILAADRFSHQMEFSVMTGTQAKYAIRLPANEILERNITELLRRPPGRPSCRPLVQYKSFLYQTATWKHARRVA